MPTFDDPFEFGSDHTIEPINFSTINYMHSYTEWLPESRARGLGGVLHKLSTELNVMRQEMR